MRGLMLASVALAAEMANGSYPHGSGFVTYRPDPDDARRQMSAAETKRARKQAKRRAAVASA